MTTPPAPQRSVEMPAAIVTCTRAFWSQRHGCYAFVFTLPGTRQRFTVYTADAYRYEIGAVYALTLTQSTPPPGPPPGRPARRHQATSTPGEPSDR